ncbi:MAG: DinB family protein [Terriglobales bacterium]
MTNRIPGYRGEFLWELEIAVDQCVAIAETIPAEKYDWRPNSKARSFSEVFVHVATGNFTLLDVIGGAAPMDLYAEVPADAQERFPGLIRRNDELVASIRDKNAVLVVLKRSLQAATDSFSLMEDGELDRSLHFFGEETTVRHVYLRLLAHTHEHMRQMIANLRFNDIALPWPDWRSDRRTQN